MQQIGQQVFAPEQPIHLVWGFINTGPAVWPADAALVHVEGERLGSSRSSFGVGGCAPAEEATVQLQLSAPPNEGSYASCWRLRYSGGYFGEPIWLMVNVGVGHGQAASAAAAATQQQQQQQHMVEDPVAMYNQLVATTNIDPQQQQMLQAQLEQLADPGAQVALLKQLQHAAQMQMQMQAPQPQSAAVQGSVASMPAPVGGAQLDDEDMDL